MDEERLEQSGAEHPSWTVKKIRERILAESTIFVGGGGGQKNVVVLRYIYLYINLDNQGLWYSQFLSWSTYRITWSAAVSPE